MQSAFYVTLETKDEVDRESYAQVAGQLCNTLHTTLGQIESLRKIVHTTEITNPQVEVEIGYSGSGAYPEPFRSPPVVVARAVLKATVPSKMTFDKNLFTKMVRSQLPFPVKITKQSISQEELMGMAIEEPA